MSWQQQTGADGLPIWRGADAILNMSRASDSSHDLAYRGWYMVGGSLVGILLLLLVGSCTERSQGGPISFMVLLALIGALFIASHHGKSKWIADGWALDATKTALEYKGARQWSAPIDQIGSVEVARTRDFTPSRQVGGSPQPVSEHEWQAFLNMSDGTRRVIYCANAARDDCGELRASIAAYVDQARGARVAASSSVPASVGAPAGEGFDL